MRSVVRDLHTPDVVDLESWVPRDARSIGIFFQVFVGTDDDDEAADSFGVMICTPEWLAGEIDRSGPVLGRHHIFVREWNWPLVKDVLTRTFADVEAEDYSAIAAKLSRLGQWEFEDFEDTDDQADPAANGENDGERVSPGEMRALWDDMAYRPGPSPNDGQ